MLTAFLFLQLWPLTLSIPAFTSLGTNFVAAFPCSARSSDKVRLYMTTYAIKANVFISIPLNLHKPESERTKEEVLLKRYRSFIFELEKKHCMEKKGMYASFIINALAPIKIYGGVLGETKSDFFELIPLQTCQKSYYATTLGYFPFFAVLTFGEGTSLRVSFENVKPVFNEFCSADINCSPGKQVTVNLKNYSVWHFQLSGDFDLHHTFIEAESRVFVLTGNTICSAGTIRRTSGRDLCIAPAKPTVAWGKEYVVPIFEEPNDREKKYKSTLYFRINSRKTPFPINIMHKALQKNIVIQTHVPLLDLHKEFSYLVYSPFIVSAKSPFELGVFYKLLELTDTHFPQHLAFLNLVPVEQWTNGAACISNKKSLFGRPNKTSFDAFFVSTTKNLRTPEIKQFRWKSLTVNNVNRSFYYAILNLQHRATRIFTERSNGKVMVYMSGINEHSFSLRAIGFYQGVIYSPACRATTPTASDGMDNDCDGHIDEEFDNGSDDDGDGKVDEDVALYPGSPSKWTTWKYVPFKCSGYVQRHKIRSCKFGLFSDVCDGKNTICEPFEECPEKCEPARQETTCSAVKKECDICQNGTCLQCKDGYVPSDFCLIVCPEHWSGPGCAYFDRKNQEISDEDNNDNDFNLLIDSLRLILLPILGVALCLFFLMVLKRKKKKRRPSNDDEQDDVSDTSNDDDEDADGNNDEEEEEEEDIDDNEGDVDREARVDGADQAKHDDRSEAVEDEVGSE